MTYRSSISDFFGLLGSAIAAVSAEENGRKAPARDLRRLGIDPIEFRKIRRF